MKNRFEIIGNDGNYALVKLEAKDLSKLQIRNEYRETLLSSYLGQGFPKIINDDGEVIEKAYDGYREDNGNVVVAYTNSCYLMLDCDLKLKREVIRFARDYAKTYDLGSVLVFRTSESTQVDLLGRVLGNFAVIFGRRISWDEIKWHVLNAYQLGLINKGFLILRKFGSTTIRVNAKNEEIPPLEPICYISSDKKGREGTYRFVRYWIKNRNLGMN